LQEDVIMKKTTTLAIALVAAAFTIAFGIAVVVCCMDGVDSVPEDFTTKVSESDVIEPGTNDVTDPVETDPVETDTESVKKIAKVIVSINGLWYDVYFTDGTSDLIPASEWEAFCAAHNYQG
jgi:hypothetical protein